jgi:Uma2 family endonuclease
MTVDTAFRSDEHFTQREFRRWVEHRPRADINHYELIQGRIVMTPPAGRLHASIEAALVHLLREHAVATRLGTVFGSSAGYNLSSGDTVEPDVSFVSRERLAAAPGGGPDEFLRAAPNLVIEILSPSTAKRDLTEKKSIYERNGVDEYWIVDPRHKAVTVFHLGEDGYDAGTIFKSGAVRSQVLPKLRVRIERIFESIP